MKIAVVHEWLVDWAGSERVLEQIISCYPSADLFALVDFLDARNRDKILGKRATTSFLQRAPFARSRLAAYLPLMPFAVEQLDLSGYDIVISSSHAVAKGVVTGPDQLHLSYVHSPMRYAWDQQHQYLRGPSGRGLRGITTRGLLHYLRLWDSRTATGVQAFAANSHYVARRIWKVYRRHSTVIYPPVDTERFSPKQTKSDFFLCASRLMPYKRVDVIVDAFTGMRDKRLIVIGSGPEYRSVRKRAGSNVAFLGHQPDDVLLEHLQNASALVFAAEEDFGILPVEAQACGTPVIAFGRGGTRESVCDENSAAPTGMFFHTQSAPAIQDVVREFERNRHLFSAQACRANAERFCHARFRQEFMKFVTASSEIL